MKGLILPLCVFLVIAVIFFYMDSFLYLLIPISAILPYPQEIIIYEKIDREKEYNIKITIDEVYPGTKY